MKSVLLLSGGLDSTALAFWLRPALAITIDYGQVAATSEIAASRAICCHLGIEHEELSVDLRCLGSGPMAGSQQLSKASTPEWWPFRNQLLITLAGAIAVRRGFDELLVGSVRSDEEHADGTEHFFRLANEILKMQEGNVGVKAPALRLTTEELIETSGVPISILGWCHSCNFSNTPCMRCRACAKQISALAKFL